MISGLLITGTIGLLFGCSLSMGVCSSCSSEAKEYLSTLAIGQQVLMLEESRFAVSLAEMDKLMLNVPSETNNYQYSIKTDQTFSIIIGQSRRAEVKSHVAGVFSQKDSAGRTITKIIICQANFPGTQQIAAPINPQTCGVGTVNVNPNP